MRGNLVALILCLLLRVAGAQNPRVYYVNGDSYEQITNRGVTVTLRLNEDHGANWLTVYVVNDSEDAVNVMPSNITLHQTEPREADLRLKTERQLKNHVNHGVFWGQVLAGVGAGLSRQVSTAYTSTPYGSVSTVVNTPDYEAQARWLAAADALAAQGEAVKNVIAHDYLRATTVFPGSRFAGRLCFSRDKKFLSGFARIVLDTHAYEFQLPPPSSAPTPSSAPELPGVGNLTAVDVSKNEAMSSSAPAAPSRSTNTRPGILGVSGANWMEGDVSGVEIVAVAPKSAAAGAGLRPGNVITDVNDQPIRSTEDLASVLAQNEPGTRVRIGYIFKSNLGWMSSEAVVTLTNR